MMKTGDRKQILVIHGPNLNTLGQREPETYGYTSLADIDRELKKLGKQWGLEVSTYQSNHVSVHQLKMKVPITARWRKGV